MICVRLACPNLTVNLACNDVLHMNELQAATIESF